ncbi:DUF4232 domain-containing protein [Streptomyces oryzae]|uniref:DUF4232 domain-containing protein n=1 Tax=Streptomyces oryzae TaxID=1434886 RepID=A0ABS3XJP3_9ACTN|nr:DUF4232 domain-containing protein [Streptomyces oryzae]
MRQQQEHAARATARPEETGPGRRRAERSTRLAAVVATGLAAALLTGCGGEGSETSPPKKVAGEAAPAPADSPGASSTKKSPSPSSSSGSGGEDAEDDGAQPGSSETGGASSSGGEADSGANGGSGPGGPGVGPCKTSGLAFSTAHGMAEGSLLVHLRNTGSTTCTLQGFPGVDLTGKDGSLHAGRNNAAPPTVSLSPSEETRFTLNYPVNDTGGSGVTMTGLVVTPPNETQSKTLPVRINLPVTDGTSSSITVSPVGAGK